MNTPPSVDVLGDTVDHGSMLERPLTQAERAIELPRYTLLDVIGQGGFGRVYAAHDPVLDRTVAIKLLRRAPSSMMLDGSTSRIRSQQRAQRKLLREAHALAKLGHPNIVAVYDAGTYARPDDDEREGVFIVMEYIDGLTLDRWLTAAPRTWSEILAVFRAAGEGLVVAHAKGFCHRDFKPGNIMVTREGAVKVLDFGLASAQRNERTEPIRPLSGALEAVGVAGDTTTPTQADHIIGTPAYMAPEQWLGRATGPHSDQFSFCLALYEAIFGRSPFPGAKLEERIASLLQARYDPAPEDSPVPPRVIEAVRRGLAFRYQERYSSMSALLDALDLGVTFTTGVTAATIPNRSFHEHNTSREEQRAIRDCITWIEPGIIRYWEVPTPTIYTISLMRAQLDELIRSVDAFSMVVDIRRAYMPSQQVMEVIRGMFMDPHLVHVAAAAPDPIFRFGASFVFQPVRAEGTWSLHDTMDEALARARASLQDEGLTSS